MNTVRERATVIVSNPVSGLKTREYYGRKPSHKVTTLKVDPRIMLVVKRIMQPNQRLVIISETEVRLVNRRG